MAVVKLYNGNVVVDFNPGSHRYKVTIPKHGVSGKFYPSVTTVLGLKDKSGALSHWAVNQMELAMLQKLDTLRASGVEMNAISEHWIRTSLIESKENYRKVKESAGDVGSAAHDYIKSHCLWVHKGAEQPKRPDASLFSMDDYGGVTDPQKQKVLAALSNAAIDAALAWMKEVNFTPVELECITFSARHGYSGIFDWKAYVEDEFCMGDWKSGKRLYSEVFMQGAGYKNAELEQGKDTNGKKKKLGAFWGVHISKETGEFDAVRRDPEFFEGDFRAFLGLLEVWRWQQMDEGKTINPYGFEFGGAK